MNSTLHTAARTATGDPPDDTTTVLTALRADLAAACHFDIGFPSRETALFQLANDIPAAILARLLGIHISVATTWQRLAAGDWTSYAAHLDITDPTHPDHTP